MARTTAPTPTSTPTCSSSAFRRAASSARIDRRGGAEALRSALVLVDGFDVDLDEDLLADEEAAGLERLVPRDAELIAVDSRRGVEARSQVSPRVDRRTGEL